MNYHLMIIGNTSQQKNWLYNFFWTSKTTFIARITEPSNNDYDNDVSDNCDHSFGTFDDFGVKNNQKVSHNMILMSKYKGQHGGKKGKQIRAGVFPPPFRAMPERKHFFFRRASLSTINNPQSDDCQLYRASAAVESKSAPVPWGGEDLRK